MNRVLRSAAVAAVVASGVAARRALEARGRGHWPAGGIRLGMGRWPVAGARRDGARGDGEPRWHVVTVNRPREEVAPDGQLPEPLARLGDTVAVELRPAPGNRGTEVAARPRQQPPGGLNEAVARLRGEHPEQVVRKALREAKMLVETGEVLQPDKPGTTRRTPLNRPLEFATRHGRQEGLL